MIVISDEWPLVSDIIIVSASQIYRMSRSRGFYFKIKVLTLNNKKVNKSTSLSLLTMSRYCCYGDGSSSDEIR